MPPNQYLGGGPVAKPKPKKQEGGLSTIGEAVGQAASSIEKAAPRVAPQPRQVGRGPVVPPTTAPSTLPAPYAQPNPILQKHGVPATVDALNTAADQIVSSYRAKFGRVPTPGLVFDVLRTPVPPEQYSDLFKAIPVSKALAQAGFHEPDVGAFTYNPKTGLADIHAPVAKLAENIVGEHPITFAELHKENFPTVQMGFIPSANFGALPTSFGQVERLARVWSDLVGPGQASFSDPEKELRQIIGQATSHGGLYTAPSGKTYTLGELAQYRAGIGNIKEAQRYLNDRMGTQLPVNGWFTQDWIKSYANWTKTKDFLYEAANRQASAEGFSNYGDFLKAYNNKKSTVEKHGWAQWFLNSLPLQSFSNGGDPWAILTASGSYVKQPIGLSPNTLHALTRGAELAFGAIGGSIQELEASTAAANKLATLALTGTGGGKFDMETAKKEVSAAFHKQPSLLRAVYPDLPTGSSAEAIATATELVASVILLRHPIFTGEKILPGDLEATLKSPYIERASNFAYTDLANGKLEYATSMLEGGRTSEKLAVKAQKLIQQGKMTRDQFRRSVADLYAHAETTLPDGTVVTGRDFLHSLNTDRLYPPSMLHMQVKRAMRTFVDDLDQTLRGPTPYGVRTARSRAADFVSTLRAGVSHVAPAGQQRHFFEPRLPERVHDYVISKKLGDAQYANDISNALVKARAADDVPGILAVQRDLMERYHAKYPKGGVAQDEIERLLTASQSASRFTFLGYDPEVWDNALGQAQGVAANIHRSLLRVSATWRRIILSGAPVPGGEVLFWKHMFADTARRVVGGGMVTPLDLLSKTDAEVSALLARNPDLAREWGTFYSRTKEAEGRYMGGGGHELSVPSYDTQDWFHGPRFSGPQKRRMDGAARYVDTMLTDKAFDAYLASSPEHIDPFVQLVLHDKDYQGLYSSFAQEHNYVQRTIGPPGQAALPGMEKVGGNRRAWFKPDGTEFTPEEFAQMLHDKYKALDDEFQASGQTLGAAKDVLDKNRLNGASRKKLAGWINDNRVAFKVDRPLVDRGLKGLDDAMLTWIGQLMRPNKWNRGSMAKNVALLQYKTMVKAGIKEEDALRAAMAISEKQTVYHMLDFANMLGIEQQLRFLSFFATKHRLYWKWVLSQIPRQPGMLLAAHSVQKSLDSQGNLLLPFQIGGLQLAVPVTRLFWISGREYSEYSTPVQAGIGLIQGGPRGMVDALTGTGGNIVGRNDQAALLAGNWAAIATGGRAPTLQNLLWSLPKYTTDRYYRWVNEQSDAYTKAHPGEYLTESELVHFIAWRATAEEFWRANLPLPIVPSLPDIDNKTMNLLHQFSHINDPQKRNAFLGAHPEIADTFGLTQDPTKRLHQREYWDKWRTLYATWEKERSALHDLMQKQGVTKPILLAQRKANQEFSDGYNQLLLDDARTTPGVPAPEIGAKTPDPRALGWWGQQTQGDPLTDPRVLFAPVSVLHKMFPGIPVKQLEARTAGYSFEQAQQTLDNLKQLEKTLVAQDPTHAADLKTTERLLLDYMAPFRKLPSDALGRDGKWYQDTVVTPYWKKVNKFYVDIAKVPQGPERDALYAQYRAWKDAQDKPVEHNGIKWPSPIGMAYMQMDNQKRRGIMFNLSAANWGHIAGYEKNLIGFHVPRGAQQGWDDYAALIKEAKEAYPNQQMTAEWRQSIAKAIDQAHPGFMQDYKLSLLPTAQRMKLIPFIQKETGFTSEWQDLLDTASKAYGYQKSIGSTAMKQYWRNEVVGTSDKPGPVRTWLDTQPVGFRKQIEVLGPNFLYTLVSP